MFDDYLGSARLKDALTNVLVTAFEIQKRTPWFFRSTNAKQCDEYDFPMKKVARRRRLRRTRAAAARGRGQGQGGKHWALVDGGVYANNPTMCALVDARTVNGADDVLFSHSARESRLRGLVEGRQGLGSHQLGATAPRRRVRGRERHRALPDREAVPARRRQTSLLSPPGQAREARVTTGRHRQGERRIDRGAQKVAAKLIEDSNSVLDELCDQLIRRSGLGRDVSRRLKTLATPQRIGGVPIYVRM